MEHREAAGRLSRPGDPEDRHRSGNVLQVALTERFEAKVRLILYSVLHFVGDVRRAALGERTNPRSYVDPVAYDFALPQLDVALVEADVQLKLLGVVG